MGLALVHYCTYAGSETVERARFLARNCLHVGDAHTRVHPNVVLALAKSGVHGRAHSHTLGAARLVHLQAACAWRRGEHFA